MIKPGQLEKTCRGSVPGNTRANKTGSVPNHIKRQRVAVLFSGELRLQNEAQLDSVFHQTVGADVWVSTYSRFESIGLRLCRNNHKRLHIMSQNAVDQQFLRAGAADSNTFSLRQWVHLDMLLRLASSELRKYHIVVRSRTDILFPDGFSYPQLHVLKAGIYAHSDYFFYARAPVFLRVFTDMFASALNVYTGCDVKVCAGSVHRFQQNLEGGCKHFGTPSCPTWTVNPHCSRSNRSCAIQSPFCSLGSHVKPRAMFYSEQTLGYHVTVTCATPCILAPEAPCLPKAIDCAVNATGWERHLCRARTAWGVDTSTNVSRTQLNPASVLTMHK